MGDKGEGEPAAPAYGDLGKEARDVFRSGYAFDAARIKVVWPRDDLHVESGLNIGFKSFEPNASVLAKYKAEPYGLFSLNLRSNGPQVLEWLKMISDAVKLNAGYSYKHPDAFQSAKLAVTYAVPTFHATCSLTKDMDRAADILASAVVKLGGAFLGYQGGYSVESGQMTKHDVAAAMDVENAGVHLRCVEMFKEVGLSAYYKVNEDLSVALDAKMTLGGSAPLWYTGAGLAYKLDDKSKLRVRMDKNFQLASCLQFPFQEQAKITLALSLDLLNPSAGQHRIGFGFEIDV